MKVILWARTAYFKINTNGDYGYGLYGPDNFEEKLHLTLNATTENDPDNKHYKLLFEKIEKQKGHPGNILFDYFKENLVLDFNFAKSLKLFDIIGIGCFSPADEVGEAIIELIEYADLEFVLYMKKWASKDKLELDFIVTHTDYVMDLISGLYNPEFDLDASPIL